MKDGVVGPEWLDTLRNRCKTIVAYISRLFSNKIKSTLEKRKEKKEHFFALYGADITMDQNQNVWITEIQKGPGMQIDNEVKKKMVMSMFNEMFLLIGEIQDFNRLDCDDCLKKELIFRKNFEWVINEPDDGFVYEEKNYL